MKGNEQVYAVNGVDLNLRQGETLAGLNPTMRIGRQIGEGLSASPCSRSGLEAGSVCGD